MHPMLNEILSKINNINLYSKPDHLQNFAEYDIIHLPSLINVYNNLEDKNSRDAFSRIITWRILHKFISNTQIQQYYPLFTEDEWEKLYNKAKNIKIPDVELENIDKLVTFVLNEYEYLDCKAEEGDIVLNCGAYTGGSSIYFSERVGSKGKVYTFEPMQSNYNKLLENVRNYPQIIPIKKGISDKSNKFNFIFQEMGSHKPRNSIFEIF